MNTKVACVVVLLAVVAAVQGNDCSRWCRTPERQVYCCKTGPVGSGDPSPTVNKGRCPEIRGACVQSYGYMAPPSVCSDDSDCSRDMKCCYDQCLRHHSCKPVEQ